MGIPLDAVVAGRYRIVELLGAGAASEVFRVLDLHTGLEAALKVLARAGSGETARQRFEEEVRILTSLDHPNLVPLLASGTEGGQPFFVMPFIDGRSLEELLVSGPMLPEDARRIGAAVADALSCIHAYGIVHRDIKPDNILIARDQRVFLADFGVAKAWDGPLRTGPGFAVGTAGYLAPEQADGEEATAASDIYAFGLVLLEALTGRREYTGTAAERAATSARRPPRIPLALGAPWCRILYRMLARDPAERPKTDEVRAALHLACPDAAVYVADI